MVSDGLSRRSLLGGAAGALTAGVVGTGSASAVAATSPDRTWREPLWRTAWRRGIVFGSSTATWQLSDSEYRRLYARESAILLTEDDLLWYRLKPTPDSDLDFSYGDRIVSFAQRHGMLVLGAHLVWDEGFGEGWTDDDLWGLNRKAARRLLFGTLRRTVRHYRGRVDVWSVANEVTDPEGVRGVRTNVPWYATIGPSYIAESFHLAHEADPDACLLINGFGFETVNQYGDKASDRRAATLQVIDKLLEDDVPVHGLGIQAHLLANRFDQRFHAGAYRRFLADVAARGLKIFITEMDVLDDGLPAAVRPRDRAIADVYRRYLDVTLDEPAVKSVVAFGLSDRYTWLQEDYPRDDGAARRPLAFDDDLRPKPAARAIAAELADAPWRRRFLRPPRVG
jgi:endo-1,4-beta-xylanase